MLTYTGKYATANVMIDEIDEETVKQIYSFLNHPAFEGCYIVIMPDCHAGAGAVIGFTMKLNGYVIPNVVGVDIGCGVKVYRINTKDIDFKKFDSFIKNNIPSGFAHRNKIVYQELDAWKEEKSKIYALDDNVETVCHNIFEDKNKALHQLGTLGGGNHFIEIDHHEETGDYYLVVHSGSRNFGLRTANFYQNKAKELMKTMFVGDAYKGLEYLPMEHGGEEYLADMRIAQDFAAENRYWMCRVIMEGFFKQQITRDGCIESVHNYISKEDNIIRKGAISAYNNQEVVIPFNMRDGIAIGVGRENKRWNFSAPHGAGRLMSRSKAKREISIDDFTKTMSGIYTTTATENTLDEAPMAYKDKDMIIEAIQPTVDIKFLMKPVYNFKAAE